MEETYKIPKSINEFVRGTHYQVLSIADNTWSSTKIIGKMCWSLKTDLLSLMQFNRIRIIEYGKSEL